MKIDLFFVEYDHGVFEMVGGWDEYACDANYEGYEKDLAALREKHKDKEFRVIQIEVSDKAVKLAFDPAKVQAQVTAVDGEKV
jgi:hypothetical protein